DKEIDEHEEAEEDDKAKMKKHMEVVQDDEEIAIDAIPLAIKPPITVEYKIVKEGQKGFYHLIRADGSSNRYSSMIRMLQNISREDLETLWKLVKTKHGNTRPNDVYEKVFWGVKDLFIGINTAELQSLMEVIPDEEEVAVDAIPLATKPPSIVDYKIIKEGNISYYQIIRADGSSKRPEEGYERVLWGDLKIMFEHHVEDLVWRNLQENKVLVWKLFDLRGVHFVRFQSLHVFMLVEKRYPLTPATITEMLNKKLQADH
ncbi:hypothetical protein Tco_1227299, partial [Tanacetum coccineum]